MRKNGLMQVEDSLQIYARCKILSNVILAKELLDVGD